MRIKSPISFVFCEKASVILNFAGISLLSIDDTCSISFIERILSLETSSINFWKLYNKHVIFPFLEELASYAIIIILSSFSSNPNTILSI